MSFHQAETCSTSIKVYGQALIPNPNKWKVCMHKSAQYVHNGVQKFTSQAQF